VLRGYLLIRDRVFVVKLEVAVPLEAVYQYSWNASSGMRPVLGKHEAASIVRRPFPPTVLRDSDGNDYARRRTYGTTHLRTQTTRDARRGTTLSSCPLLRTALII